MGQKHFNRSCHSFFSGAVIQTNRPVEKGGVRLSKRVRLIILLFLLSIVAPYLLVHLNTPDGHQMTGFISLSYEPDSPTYQSKMVNADGLTFQNLYNHLDQEGWTVFSLYALLGHLAKATDIDEVWMLHIARVAFSGAFALALYRFLRTLGVDGPLLPATLALVLFGNTGEFLFYLVAAGIMGFEIGLPKFIIEATPFGSALYYPHYILSLLLQVVAWTGALRYERSARPLTMLWVGFILTLYSTIHPYSAVTTGIAIGLFLVLSMFLAKGLTWKRFYPILYMGLVPLPYLIQMYREFKTNVVLVQWMGEAVLPIFLSYFVVLFGVWVIFLLFVPFDRRLRVRRHLPLFVWIGTAVFVTCLPLASSYRVLEGIGIPVLILFAYWLSLLKGRMLAVKVGTYILLLGTTLLLVAEPLWADPKVNTHWYRPDGLQDAMEWLGDHREEVDVVLGRFASSQYIPPESQVLVYIGHNHETPQGLERIKLWDLFLKDPEKQWTSGWIQRNDISHLILRRDEYETIEPFISVKGWDIPFSDKGYAIVRIKKTD